MPSPTEITISQLSRLIGLPTAPRIVDVRSDEDFDADPRMIPGSQRRDYRSVAGWAKDYAGHSVVVVCEKGQKLSQGVAAWLHHEGIAAESLEGGILAWRESGQMLLHTRQAAAPGRGGPHPLGHPRAAEDRPYRVPLADPPLHRSPGRLPFRGARGGTGRGRALRRHALRYRGGVLEPSRRALQLRHHDRGARPHRAALEAARRIIRGADTARLDLAPESAGLLAASLGLSRMYKDDLAQLEASMALYDSFYRWCRDAVEETHNWPAGKAPG